MYQTAKFRGDYGRGRYRGDPGILDVFKKVGGVVGNLLPGPVGAVVRGATSILGGNKPAALPAPTAVPRPSTSMTGIQVSTPFFSGQVGRTTTQTTAYHAALPGVGAGADGCPKGYKLNKTGYHLRDGTFVPPQSRCVRIRTRNMANGKALTRAISRAGGFERMVKRNRKNLRKLAKI